MDFRLLRTVPEIKNGQGIIPLSGKSLEVLMYMTHETHTIFRRDHLVQQLWGDKGNLGNLSVILSRLPNELKENLITPEKDVLILHRDQINVDTQRFMEQANRAIKQAEVFDVRTLSSIQKALTIYQQHFLEGYFPAIEGLVEWRERERLVLARKRDELLELMVRYQLQYGDYVTARKYAEQWRDSLEPGYIPLQYLIWIIGNHGVGSNHVELDWLLGQLAEVEETIKIGPTPAEWQHYLREYASTPLPPWLLRMRQTPDAASMVTIDSPHHPEIVGREPLTDHILRLLLANTERRMIALVGVPGVGKSVVLDAVAQAIADAPGMPRLINIHVRTETTFMQLLNAIVKQLPDANLRKLDHITKKQRSQYALQTEQHIIVIDDYDGDIEQTGILDELIDYLGRTPLLIATPKLDDPRFRTVEVPSLEVGDVRALIAYHSIPDVSEAQIEELMTLTGGLPLLLRIALSFRKEYRVRSTDDLLSQLRQATGGDFNMHDVASSYRRVLERLLNNINPRDYQLLQLIAMFDPVRGISVDELFAETLATVDRAHFKEKVERLATLALVRPLQPLPLTGADDKEQPSIRYGVHATVRRFVLPAQLEDTPAEVLRDYITIVFAYIERYQEDFGALDAMQHDILRALELAQDMHEALGLTTAFQQEMTNSYYHLERRGFYELSISLLQKALDSRKYNLSDTVNLNLHHMLGQAYSRISSIQEAYDSLDKASGIAQQLGMTESYARILLDSGILSLRLQNWQAANHFFSESLNLAETSQNTLLVCRALSNLGLCAFRQEQYDVAYDFYVRMLEAADNIISKVVKAETRFAAYKALGTTLENLNALEESAKMYAHMSVLAESLKAPIRIGYAHLSIGVLDYKQRDFDKAYQEFLTGKALIDASGYAEGQALFLWNLGSIQSMRHQFAESERYLKQALLQTNAHSIEWIKAKILLSIGKLYLRQHHSRLAESSFLEALHMAEGRGGVLAEALYGLVLNRLSQQFVVGSDRREDATQVLGDIVGDHGLTADDLAAITKGDIHKAHNIFAHELDEFPDLERYRIIEALVQWCIERVE